MKKILLLIVLLNFSFADSESAKEELVNKLNYALNCNAKISSISEVEISIIEDSKKYPGKYLISGIYKSVLSVSGNKSGISIGDEFHPQSGSFKGIVNSDLVLEEIKWKLGLFHGYIKESCLTLDEDDL